jgi:uncharacterized Zn finger protein
MPIRPCPSCQQPTARWLEESSKDAHVNYYRCEKCGTVWTGQKDDPAAPIRIITN